MKKKTLSRGIQTCFNILYVGKQKTFEELKNKLLLFQRIRQILRKNQRKRAIPLTDVAIQLLLFKPAIIAPNKLISCHLSAQYKRHRRKIMIEFHSLPLPHAVKSIILKRTLNYIKMIPILVESFRNLHEVHSNATKTWVIFQSEVHSKQDINPELLNSHAHNAKDVLSLATLRKDRDPSDPLRSLIILPVPLPMSSTV